MLVNMGSLYNYDDSPCHKCFTDFRFGQKLNIMMSFNPHVLECSCCGGKVLVDHKAAIKTERPVFVITDQSFPASACADGNGQCLKIIRVENGSLWEIFTIFYDTIRLGKLHAPAGSVVLLGSASHLADVGVAAYADELGAVAKRILSLFGGCVYFSPCPMLLLAGSNCSMLLRSIIEINAWFSVVMADSVSFCADTMKAAVEVLYKLKTGDSAANCCRLMLPTGFGSGNAKKKWESGSANLPAGVLSLSKSDESCLILLLVKELNDRLGLQLDPTPNLCREVEVLKFW